MANVDRPSGFLPVGNVTGAPYNASIQEYSVASSYGTALFVGDPVKSSGTADTDGVPGVEQAAAGDTMIGVIVGIRVEAPEGAKEHPGYMPASTGGIVMVQTDPNTIYEVQASGTTAAAAAGNTGDHLMTAGSTTTGASAAELDSSSVGTGAGWKILGFSQRPDNEPANANSKLRVKINEHEFVGAGTGV